ncbi:MAG: ABC transporter permease subunit [Thermosphaera sp.]
MGLIPIIRKEVADHLSSKRFLLVFALILVTGLSTSYMGSQSLAAQPLREMDQTTAFLRLFTGAPSPIPPFIYFMSIFGPILGVALTFDAINREIASGSMLRLLSNPLHRDSIINGKIIAGLIVVLVMISSVVGIVTGFNMVLVGFGPNVEGVMRIMYFILLSTVYVGLWMSISLLFSIIFRRTTTSALACLALWAFFNFFIYMIASIVAELLVPLGAYKYTPPPLYVILAHEEVRLAILRISPGTLYLEAVSVLLNPEVKSMELVYVTPRDIPVPKLLPLDESLMLAWPHVSALISGLVICLILSYIAFMRIEIRPSWA